VAAVIDSVNHSSRYQQLWSITGEMRHIPEGGGIAVDAIRGKKHEGGGERREEKRRESKRKMKKQERKRKI
jgi:hypothetical protein